MREVSWRSKCPGIVLERLVQATTSSLLLVQENGPTSFVLKDDRQTKFRVAIGSKHSCNCPQSREDLSCVHVLWVLARLFRLPQDNPLLWQHSFLEAEIEQICSGRNRWRKQRITGSPNAKAVGEDEDPNAVPRKPIQDDDSCPICCDDIREDDIQRNNLVYCRYGCGNNIHVNCFKQYAVHNSTNPQPLACPLCRNKWGSLDLPTPISQGKVNQLKRAAGLGLPPAGQCSSCKLTFSTPEVYKCAFCAEFQLCTNCFLNPMVHPQHPFDVSVDGSEYVPATRPRAPPSQTSRQTAGGGGGASQAVGSAGQEQLDPSDPRTALLHRDLGPEDYEMLLQLDEGTNNAQGSSTQVLTVDEVRRLRGRRVFTGNLEELGGYDACVVCLEKFEVADPVIILSMCHHVFHDDCLATWAMESKAVCPVDNQPLVVPPPLGGTSVSATASAPLQSQQQSTTNTTNNTAGSAANRGRGSSGANATGRSRTGGSASDGLGVVGTSSTVNRTAGRQPGGSRSNPAQRPPANKRRSSQTTGFGAGADLTSLLTVSGQSASAIGHSSTQQQQQVSSAGNRAGLLPSRPAAGRPPQPVDGTTTVGSASGLAPVLGLGTIAGTPDGAAPPSLGNRSRSSNVAGSRPGRGSANSRTASSGVGGGRAGGGGGHQEYAPSASDLAGLMVGNPGAAQFQFQPAPVSAGGPMRAPMSRPLPQGRLR